MQRLCLLALLVLAPTQCASRTATVAQEIDFLNALFDSLTLTIKITSNMKFTANAWALPAKPNRYNGNMYEPFTLDRNITIQGTLTAPGAPPSVWVHTGFMHRKVLVPAGTTVTIKDLILVGLRTPRNYNIPGISLFALEPNATLIIEDSVIVYEFCAPYALMSRYAHLVPRAPLCSFTPNDTKQDVQALDGNICTSTPNPWAEPRTPGSPDPVPSEVYGQPPCWPLRVQMDDYCVRAPLLTEDEGDFQDRGGKVWYRNVPSMCDRNADMECWVRNGTSQPNSTACIEEAIAKFGLDTILALQPPPPAPAQPSEASEEGGSGPNLALAVALPVCVGAALLAATASFVIIRRRRRHQEGDQSPATSTNKSSKSWFGDAEAKGNFNMTVAPTTPMSSSEAKNEGVTQNFLEDGMKGGWQGKAMSVASIITDNTPLSSRMDVDCDSEIVLAPNGYRGAGSFGQVYECMFNGQRAALKLVHSAAQVFTSSKELDSLAKEVEILARANHPNVVRLLGACLKPPNVCLVMELMDRSLSQVIHGPDPHSSLGLGELLAFAKDIAQGLDYLHPTVIHQDLKPANVLVSTTGQAKITDFGVARLRAATTLASSTGKGSTAGTSLYMAPEMFDSSKHSVTHKVDIFAWATLVWEMITRKAPWDGLSFMQIAFAVTVKKQRLPLPDDDSRCPRRLRKLLLECWDEDPQRRPSAGDLVKQIMLLQGKLQRGASGHGSGVAASDHNSQGSTSQLVSVLSHSTRTAMADFSLGPSPSVSTQIQLQQGPPPAPQAPSILTCGFSSSSQQHLGSIQIKGHGGSGGGSSSCIVAASGPLGQPYPEPRQGPGNGPPPLRLTSQESIPEGRPSVSGAQGTEGGLSAGRPPSAAGGEGVGEAAAQGPVVPTESHEPDSAAAVAAVAAVAQAVQAMLGNRAGQ